MIQILGKLIFSVDILQGLMQLYIIASAAFGHVILENPPAMSKYKAMVFAMDVIRDVANDTHRCHRSYIMIESLVQINEFPAETVALRIT